MDWKYFEPKFEYEEEFDDIGWPWAGHKFFAYDLIANLKPKRIVELGTHYGTSLWAFSQAVKDQETNTELFAVDTWEGEAHAGFYGEEVFDKVKRIKEKFYPNLKINLVRKTFDEALKEFENESIDILHIDGLHTYEAVKHDFEAWLPKVEKNGMVLLHDIIVKRTDFGVYKLWEELKEKYQTMEFHYSYGLGVLSKGEGAFPFDLKEEMESHYAYLLEEIENGKANAMLEGLKNKDQEIESLKRLIQQKDQEIKDNKREIKIMKSSKFWKMREEYLNLKNKFLKK